MMKDSYESPNMEIIVFNSRDILIDDSQSLPFVPVEPTDPGGHGGID